MAIDYKEGDVVVCVAADGDRSCVCGCGETDGLKQGGLYRVAHMWICTGGKVAIDLVEMVYRSSNHRGFKAAKFRKAFTPDTEVSREIIEPIPSPPKKVTA